VALFAWYGWPTPWRYDHFGLVPVRTHRVFGIVERLDMQRGWVRIGRAVGPGAMAPSDPDRVVDTTMLSDTP